MDILDERAGKSGGETGHIVSLLYDCLIRRRWLALGIISWSHSNNKIYPNISTKNNENQIDKVEKSTETREQKEIHSRIRAETCRERAQMIGLTLSFV